MQFENYAFQSCKVQNVLISIPQGPLAPLWIWIQYTLNFCFLIALLACLKRKISLCVFLNMRFSLSFLLVKSNLRLLRQCFSMICKGWRIVFNCSPRSSLLLYLWLILETKWKPFCWGMDKIAKAAATFPKECIHLLKLWTNCSGMQVAANLLEML